MYIRQSFMRYCIVPSASPQINLKTHHAWTVHIQGVSKLMRQNSGGLSYTLSQTTPFRDITIKRLRLKFSFFIPVKPRVKLRQSMRCGLRSCMLAGAKHFHHLLWILQHLINLLFLIQFIKIMIKYGFSVQLFLLFLEKNSRVKKIYEQKKFSWKSQGKYVKNLFNQYFLNFKKFPSINR